MNFDGVELKEVDNIPCDDDVDHQHGEYLGRYVDGVEITTRYRCTTCEKILEDVYVEEKVGERIIDKEKDEYSEDYG
jgi:DNA-directed RNA polymerase subunit RPC12/RpoP